jgi:hypothetical protein
MGVLGDGIPLFHEHVEVLMHVDFELGDAFRGEGMGYRFTLAGVFCSVSGVEETAADGDEDIVEIPPRY